MSYQERRSLVNLLSTVLMVAVYGWFMWQRRPLGDPYAPELFLFWGRFFVILIPVAIVLSIVNQVVFVILNSIATGEVEPEFSDERDTLIDLKASRMSLYVFALGLLASMALLALGQPPTVMFVTLFLAGALSSILSSLLEVFYYRRGV